MTTLTQTILLRLLMHSAANVRRTAKTSGIGDLAASIAAHGLRQNLNVRPRGDGRYEVVAGGRRLRALRLLAERRQLAKDTPIPCLVLAEGDDPSEISLAENAMREAMHPDDQCDAFRRLIEESGLSVEDVAARFGVTPAVVRQRLKLAAVSPRLRGLYRKGEMGLEHVMALTLTDDHAAQEAAWSALPDWNRAPAALKRLLTQESLPAHDRLARFVGLEAYEAVGGTILRDLFEEATDGYLADRALVERLAAARMADLIEAVQAEGWKWVKPELTRDYETPYRRIYPGADGEYTAEEKARAGVRILIDHDGEPSFERGLIHPDDGKREAREGRPAATGTGELSARMVEELSAHRTAALRIELSRRPDVALAATVHALALPLLYPYGDTSCLAVRAVSEPLSRHVAAEDETPAHRAMAEEAERWGDRLPGDASDLFAWCLAEPQESLLDLLAFLAALTVDAVTSRSGTGQTGHADRLAEALSLDMQAWWTPSVEGFYRRLPKAALATALTEAAVPPLGVCLSTVKKAEAARLVADALAGSSWLPAPLRLQQAAA